MNPDPASSPSAPTGKVTGIGGVFFKAKDPEALAAWYQEHLGLEVHHSTMATFEWKELPEPHAVAQTVWAAFPESTDHLGPVSARCMINYRVRGLDTLLERLRHAGVRVQDGVEEYDYGRFAWILDSEGNRVELWEPTEVKPH